MEKKKKEKKTLTKVMVGGRGGGGGGEGGKENNAKDESRDTGVGVKKTGRTKEARRNMREEKVV